ncbi:phosphopantetheine-binding protein [Nonomuraea sp. NPDC046802]|uniref:acyl carrier protein n=1 Tax=Nonomuraea sp. NPDC046802 TaxID=3154919 RepID=UPI0033E29F3D
MAKESMTSLSATNVVLETLARHTGMDQDEIDPGMRVQEDLGLDSLDAVELLMVLEQETSCRFDIGVANGIATVGDIIERLHAAMS